MINDILHLRSIDFSSLKLPRVNYVKQFGICENRVDQATACTIHYGLNTGMVICYLKREYVGESRDADTIIATVSPYISNVDRTHIKCIINQGCPSYINFEEEYKNKHIIFLQYPEVTTKTMNKEEKSSHVLPFWYWLVHFSPYCQATPQGI